MPLSEADTRAKLIDPAIHKRGWTEDLICREETAGSIEILGGKARRRARGRVDYVLRVKVNPNTQPVAVALIEAKKDTLPPGHGLDQGMGFSLEAPAARPLLTPYTGGEATRRYYQDAAIRAGYSPNVLRLVEGKDNYDLYGVLAELGWGMNPRTREDRTLAFRYKHEDWLNTLPAQANATIRAITGQFAQGGTEGLENPHIFQTPAVRAAGGLEALKLAGVPAELLRQTKVRMFAA